MLSGFFASAVEGNFGMIPGPIIFGGSPFLKMGSKIRVAKASSIVFFLIILQAGLS